MGALSFNESFQKMILVRRDTVTGFYTTPPLGGNIVRETSDPTVAGAENSQNRYHNGKNKTVFQHVHLDTRLCLRAKEHITPNPNPKQDNLAHLDFFEWFGGEDHR